MRARSGVRAFVPWLLTAALVDWAGTGMFLAVSTVFFVRVVGLPVAQVGLGLTIAALAAMTMILPIGRLADRYGPRGVLMADNPDPRAGEPGRRGRFRSRSPRQGNATPTSRPSAWAAHSAAPPGRC